MLVSQLIQDNTVLESVVQQQEVPVIEHDPNLDLLLRSAPNFTAVSDPNAEITDQHILSPTVTRSINQENADLVRVYISYCMTHKLFQPNTSTWTDDLETSVTESNHFVDYIEQPHLLSMRIDRMGTVQATQIVSHIIFYHLL